MSELATALAAAAARLVVEQGMEYGDAKRKVARGLRRVNAPTNAAIEDEVRCHLSLYCASTQPVELRALRRLALKWMLRLAEFRPHLSGAAWRGTATRLSSLHLDLYCDDAKAMEIGLINLGITYDSDSLPAGHGGRRGGEPVPLLSVTDACPELGVPVTLFLAVRDLDDLRGALKPDSGGRTWRGDASELRRLLDAEVDL
jgi:hypothetical protein